MNIPIPGEDPIAEDSNGVRILPVNTYQCPNDWQPLAFMMEFGGRVVDAEEGVYRALCRHCDEYFKVRV